ncbi:MAG: Coenzyme F420:L-glutamate ligase [Candidatus Heimdallarchaeota archaeon LC_3]|nr:MAG: Coenzyme F420:L-glutamate ligase [Candidatus Heimdallarchaeota archaeon LC_3]
MKFELIGIKTKFIKVKENIFDVFCECLEEKGLKLEHNDVIAISSKIIALEQNLVIDLSSIPIHSNSKDFAKLTNLDPRFISLVIRESDIIYGGVNGALLTLRDGLLQANAGIDQSNTSKGTAILLPTNPNEYADFFKQKIQNKYSVDVSIIIVDSATRPLRRGTTGLCLGYSKDFPAVLDDRGSIDLLGNKMTITTRAIADNLATTANLVMGESNQRTPFAIIRGLPLNEWQNDFKTDINMKIAFTECLYFKNFTSTPLYSKSDE